MWENRLPAVRVHHHEDAIRSVPHRIPGALAQGRRERRVPELSSQLLLDILLGFIVLLFVPFGIRRGVAREGLVSAGLLLGATLATIWGPRAGGWLSDRLGIDQGTATFSVVLIMLLGGVFLIGYGAGAAMAHSRPSFWSRIAGGVLAAVNGLVFLGYLLRSIQDNLNPGLALDDGIVTNILLNKFDLLLLAAAAIASLLIVIGWVNRAINGDDVDLEPALPTRGRPVKVAPDPDPGKFDPAPTQAASRAMLETAPLPQAAEVWRAPASNGNGSSQARPRSEEPAIPVGTAASTWSAWGRNDPLERLGNPGKSGRACPTCGAPASASDLYCPECGKTL